MSYKVFLFFLLCICFFSCIFEDDSEPVYNAKIAWASPLVSNNFTDHAVDGDSVFFFERPPGYDTVTICALTRLDAQTGAFIWRSDVLFSYTFCQPLVIGGYVYVVISSRILCFNLETGEHTATVNANIDNKNLSSELYFPVVYNEYIYLSLYRDSGRDGYFARLDSNLINQNGDSKTIQDINLEVLWDVDNFATFTAKPVIYNNTVFTGTSGNRDRPIELAGFDLDSLKMVFHCSFGGQEDKGTNIVDYDSGWTENPILIHEGVLYYIGDSVSAWDITSGEKLYRHILSYDTPEPERYWSECLQPLYYHGCIYFTNITSYSPDRFRNIHCMDAATGKLVWNTIAVDSESLRTNPIIANCKLFLPQYDGFRVYNPKNGDLLGVDKTFRGVGMGRNVLYKNLMICIRQNKNGDGCLVAVDVSK